MSIEVAEDRPVSFNDRMAELYALGRNALNEEILRDIARYFPRTTGKPRRRSQRKRLL